MSWGAVIGVGGSLLGGALASSGANRAADTQADAAAYAADLQNEQYYQTREDMAPWMDAGASALNEMRRQLGLPPIGGTSYGAAYGGGRTTIGGTGGAGSSPYFRNPSNSYSRGDRVTPQVVNEVYQYYKGRAPSQFEIDYYTNEKSDKRAANRREQFWSIIERGPTAGSSRIYNKGGSEPYTGPTTPMGERTLPSTAIVGAPGGPTSGSPTGGEAPSDDPYGAFRAAPGYQWLFDETMRGVNAGVSSSGRFYSGARDKARARYAAGLADQSYGDWYARLQSMAGQGQTAVNNSGIFGANAANNAGSAALYGGAARASGINSRYGFYADAANTLGTALSDWWSNRGSTSGGSSSNWGPYSENYRFGT